MVIGKPCKRPRLDPKDHDYICRIEEYIEILESMTLIYLQSQNDICQILGFITELTNNMSLIYVSSPISCLVGFSRLTCCRSLLEKSNLFAERSLGLLNSKDGSCAAWEYYC